MTRRTMDFYHRMACSMVWNERRTGETHLDVATRCAEQMAHMGLEDVDPRKVIDWAIDERADRLVRNEMQTDQNKGRIEERRPLPPVDQERLAEMRYALINLIERSDQQLEEARRD